ncbi:MAG TPA: acyclic terpene utilization AtuA family protein [Candidatus Brocadiia bacterium]|nr:acyclic terpene utilization AtuA family protein [Candidatus Brocadiia bacterium]
MDEMRILSPSGILGYGFPRASLERGLAGGLDMIGVDAGSTDPGPAYLGMGKCFVDRAAVKRDLELLIAAALGARIPLIIGTAGGSGAKVHVDGCLGVIDEVLRAMGKTARAALIYCDVPKQAVKDALKQGRIRPLPFAPKLTAQAVTRTTRIVAQVGVDMLLPALEGEPDIIVAGRCYDPAVFAALPVARGFDPGPALHMGKILECGAIAATPGSGRDCVLGVLRKDSFRLESLNPERRFTVDSVAAHTLYEKSHPYLLPGPGGHLDLSECRFEQTAPGVVQVSGSRFVPAPQYAVKLEGAARVGFRTIAIAGARDRIMIERLDDVYAGVRAAVENNFGQRPYRLNFRTYGRDGVMGALEPKPTVEGHEVGIIFDVVAPTQKEADTICGFARSTALHYGYPGRVATAGNLAFPFSPSDVSMGPVYEFSVYHLMDLDDPRALFPVQRLTLGGQK